MNMHVLQTEPQDAKTFGPFEVDSPNVAARLRWEIKRRSRLVLSARFPLEIEDFEPELLQHGYMVHVLPVNSEPPSTNKRKPVTCVTYLRPV